MPVLWSRRLVHFSQASLHEVIAIMEHVSNRIGSVVSKAPNVGAIPTASGHVRRESTKETELLVDLFRRNKQSGGHAMVAFNDRERAALVNSDQQNGVGNAFSPQVCSHRAHLR